MAHLAVLDTRPALYAAQGYGSLFGYCTQSSATRDPHDVMSAPSTAAIATAPVCTAPLTAPRPTVQAWAPERYRVQFTIGQETQEKLRRWQALLRREIPDGDPAAIFDRALTLLLEKVERTKLAAAARPRPDPAIRPGTDKRGVEPARPSRHVSRPVKRAVWQRDNGHCAFVSPAGRRCGEHTFLEFHHIQPHAKQGPPTVENIALRCRRHNQYEAELIVGPHSASIVRERAATFGVDGPALRPVTGQRPITLLKGP